MLGRSLHPAAGAPLALMLVFALSRIPGMLPQNFSAAYALVFCAGVYFSGAVGWWLPFTTLLVTDLGLDLYYRFYLNYQVFEIPTLKYQLFKFRRMPCSFGWDAASNRARLSLPCWAGRDPLAVLPSHIITNTASWLFNPFGNPEYTRNLAGWITALTKGTAGWPETWKFFINTLLSGGIFTGLFVGAVKWLSALKSESALDKEPQTAPAEEADAEQTPEDAKS